ncbi:hypothetical protein MF271_22710 (plasmid) [Deinococcus sp. KNUC1210]|uniref:hypothetical protein n=1 Tax=Deinococcus sp. KNUC1210 TaxID=2917691 RepID=UPI001EF0CBD0|nr:hypothetical protein [Deinococcus sp. KNUC1210]ULH18278.1 hypothetical protein MF271_22710 [Deinococcus sp. KNUC1210]
MRDFSRLLKETQALHTLGQETRAAARQIRADWRQMLCECHETLLVSQHRRALLRMKPSTRDERANLSQGVDG